MSVTVISADRTRHRKLPGEFWRYRHLLGALIVRDLRVRYKQSIVGPAWIVLQPLALMLVIVSFLGLFVRFPTDLMPYPVFVYCGLMVWQFVSRVVSEGSGSILANAALIKKIYFPRILLPVTTLLTGLVDLSVTFVALVVMILLFGIPVSGGLLAVPLFILLAAAASLGIALLLGGLAARFRDIPVVVPVLMQLWFFATPVFYPRSILPTGLQPFYALNPMVGIVEGLRSALVAPLPWPEWWVIAPAVAVPTVLLIIGMAVFRRAAVDLADYL